MSRLSYSESRDGMGVQIEDDEPAGGVGDVVGDDVGGDVGDDVGDDASEEEEDEDASPPVPVDRCVSE